MTPRTDAPASTLGSRLDSPLGVFDSGVGGLTVLRALLAQLPRARDREILARFYLDGQNKDDVCRHLGIDAAHFRRVVFRARARFRELLDSAGIGEA